MVQQVTEYLVTGCLAMDRGETEQQPSRAWYGQVIGFFLVYFKLTVRYPVNGILYLLQCEDIKLSWHIRSRAKKDSSRVSQPFSPSLTHASGALTQLPPC